MLLLPTDDLYAVYSFKQAYIVSDSLKVLMEFIDPIPDGCAFVRKQFLFPLQRVCVFVLSDCFRAKQRLRGRFCLRTVCWKTSTLMRNSWEKKTLQRVRCHYTIIIRFGLLLKGHLSVTIYLNFFHIESNMQCFHISFLRPIC